jgi:hypothetical protein
MNGIIGLPQCIDLSIISPFEHRCDDRDEYTGRRRQRVEITGWKSSPEAARRKPPASENPNSFEKKPSKVNG